jgi:hypothetical protein
MLGAFAALIAWVAQASDELRPGLVGEYFHVGERLSDFPALAADAKPRFKRVDRQIDFLRTHEAFGGTKLRDGFCVRWTGLLRAPRAGKLRLFTVSDEGSRLFIGGKLVVDNGGRHEMKEASGEAELAAGDHELRVEYFEDVKHAGIRVEWEAEGLARDVIPASAFFHRKDRAPTDEERKGIDLPVDEARAAKDREPAPKAVEKKADPPKPEPALDESIVGKDEPRPEVWGRVTGVFEDGGMTLLTVKRAGQEYSVFLHKDTKLSFAGAGGKPAVGQAAYVWLKPGTADQAAAARFAK